MEQEKPTTTQSLCEWLLSMKFWPAVLTVWFCELAAAAIVLRCQIEP